MLASDILPPRTVSSRGMKRMLDRLETDSPGNYTFKLTPPSPFCEAKGGRGAQRSRGFTGSSGEVSPIHGGNVRRTKGVPSPSRSPRDHHQGREQAKRRSQRIREDAGKKSQPIIQIT